MSFLEYAIRLPLSSSKVFVLFATLQISLKSIGKLTAGWEIMLILLFSIASFKARVFRLMSFLLLNHKMLGMKNLNNCEKDFGFAKEWKPTIT